MRRTPHSITRKVLAVPSLICGSSLQQLLPSPPQVASRTFLLPSLLAVLLPVSLLAASILYVPRLFILMLVPGAELNMQLEQLRRRCLLRSRGPEPPDQEMTGPPKVAPFVKPLSHALVI